MTSQRRTSTIPVRNCLIVLLILVTNSVGMAQRIGAVRGWFSTPGCVSDVAIKAASNPEEPQTINESPTLADSVREISQSIPSGRGKILAQSLERLLAPRTHLKYVCKDDSEGGYIVRYPRGLGTDFVSDSEFVEFRFELPNLGHPEIEFDVMSIPTDGIFIYSYQVSNGTDAKRAIRSWSFVADAGDQSIRLENPLGWNNNYPADNSPVAPQAALFEDLMGPELMRRVPLGKIARWTRQRNEIEPGETRGGFTTISSLSPGWTTAYVSAGLLTPLPVLFGEIPEPVQEEMLFLQRWENRQSAIPIIGPTFGSDIGREQIARNWQVGIRTMITHGWLSARSPYVAELLQFLGDAPEKELNSRIVSEPMSELEALLDRIIRMAF